VVGCDLADAIGGDGAWDVVTAVAPYVPTEDLRLLPSDVRAYEPRAALDGGVDGLDHVRGVVAAADRLLRPGGHLLVEIGGDQAEALGRAAADHGFDTVETWHDDDGDLRGLMARQRYSARSRYVMATHPGTTGIQNVARR
jgi:release factor glutamine methyltransferase